MKKILFGALSILIFSLSFGQSFEGKLTYKVEFDIKTKKIGNIEITKEQIIKKMKDDGSYFDTVTIIFKDGNYIKQDNSDSETKLIYISDANKIYTFQKDFEYVSITDANKYNTLNLNIKEPKVEKIDSLKVINGNTCKLLELSWDKLGKEYYFYNSEIINIDSKLFENHKYEYLNTIIFETNSYPLEIIKNLNGFGSTKMTLTAISQEKIDGSIFELPKFKKAEKDYTELMLKLTGTQVMKIKN